MIQEKLISEKDGSRLNPPLILNSSGVLAHGTDARCLRSCVGVVPSPLRPVDGRQRRDRYPLLGRAKETGCFGDKKLSTRHRLNLYHEQTEAVVDQYARRGILTKVHGSSSVSEVRERVFDS